MPETEALPTRHHSSAGFAFSWGHYHTAWMYAETIEEVAERSIAWAEQQLEADKLAAQARPRAREIVDVSGKSNETGSTE